MKGFKDKSGKFRPTENKHGVRKSRDQSTKTQGVKINSETRMLRETDPEFERIKDKKIFIEPLILQKVTRDENNRKIIMARNYRLDFESPYLYYGVTDSGNVKLGEITAFPYKGHPEEVRNLIGKPYFDRGNNALNLSIDGSRFHVSLGDNDLNQLLEKEARRGNLR